MLLRPDVIEFVRRNGISLGNLTVLTTASRSFPHLLSHAIVPLLLPSSNSRIRSVARSENRNSKMERAASGLRSADPGPTTSARMSASVIG